MRHSPATMRLLTLGLPALLVLAASCTRKQREPYFSGKAIAIEHPAASGTLPTNESGKPHKGFETLLNGVSLTKLTDSEVCVDVGRVDESHKPDSAKFMASVKHTTVQFYTTKNRWVPAPLTKEFPAVIVGQHEGTYTQSRSVTTGNRETVCVEDLLDQWGAVVGCARYVDQDEVARVTDVKRGTIYTAAGGARFCAPNDGIVAPDGRFLQLTISGLSHRFDLSGGQPKEGKWGATGGKAVDAAIAALPQREASASPAPDTSASAPTGKKPQETKRPANERESGSVEPPHPSTYKTNIPQCDALYRAVIECSKSEPDKSRKRIYDSIVQGAATYREAAADPKKRKLAAETCVKQEAATRKHCKR